MSLLLLRVFTLFLLLLIFLKSFGGNTPVLSVQATTPAARNSFESPVPNFLASFALLLLLHQLALIQYLWGYLHYSCCICIVLVDDSPAYAFTSVLLSGGHAWSCHALSLTSWLLVFLLHVPLPLLFFGGLFENSMSLFLSGLLMVYICYISEWC